MSDFSFSEGGAKVSVHGVDRFTKALSKAGAGVQKMPEVVHKAGLVIEKDAKQRTPVRTGRLRNSIRAGHGPSKLVIWAGGGKVDYAAPVHFGVPGRKYKAQPYLQDAFNAKASKAIAILDKEGVGGVLKETGLI